MSLIRLFTLFLSVLLISTCLMSSGFSWVNLGIGITCGLAFGLTLLSSELLLKKFSFRSLCIALIGLLIGLALGQTLFLILNSSLSNLDPEAASLIKSSLYVIFAYVGMLLAHQTADEFYLSIPFIRLEPTKSKKKELIIDSSTLNDPRIIDLSQSGLIDHQIVIPSFVINELKNGSEIGEENIRLRAKKCLEVLKKLENMPTLHLQYDEGDFLDTPDLFSKLIKLARKREGYLLTADLNRIQQGSIEGIRIINLHLLSNALKPITQTGEQIEVKIIRKGKDDTQGVGYLDDGTMVVVNGGGYSLGQMMKASVLSVKHTSSGRLIFCNANDQDERLRETMNSLEHPPRNYFVQESLIP